MTEYSKKNYGSKVLFCHDDDDDYDEKGVLRSPARKLYDWGLKSSTSDSHNLREEGHIQVMDSRYKEESCQQRNERDCQYWSCIRGQVLTLLFTNLLKAHARIQITTRYN